MCRNEGLFSWLQLSKTSKRCGTGLVSPDVAIDNQQWSSTAAANAAHRAQLAPGLLEGRLECLEQEACALNMASRAGANQALMLRWRTEAKEVIETRRALHAAQRQSQETGDMAQQAGAEVAIDLLSGGEHLQQGLGSVAVTPQNWI
jgi:hypothetical protein